jgi:hypothetical protein
VAEFTIDQTPANGIPYWDGAPGWPGWGPLSKPADPFNDFEQWTALRLSLPPGLLRLGLYLNGRGKRSRASLHSAGLTVTKHVLAEPYLHLMSHRDSLHSVYHRPNGWDHVPAGKKIPCGESTMWGDYHAREVALMVMRMADGKTVPLFFLTPRQ